MGRQAWVHTAADPGSRDACRGGTRDATAGGPLSCHGGQGDEQIALTTLQHRAYQGKAIRAAYVPHCR